MSVLSYFPVVEKEGQLVDLLSRAAWFLSFCPIDRIYVPIAKASLQEVGWRVAPGMDVAIAENFNVLRQKVVFVTASVEDDLDVCMTEATIILRWKEGSVPAFVSSQKLAEWEKGKKIFQVDPVAIRQEGSHYIDVGLHLLTNKQALIDESKTKFRTLATQLGKFERAYLMATGPSIGGYEKFDYTNALSIVCNSVILDEELMDLVCPQILVFADPIFHFGPSEYAGTFRRKLLESTKKHDYTICIPLKYYGLFVASMPELAHRTIGIPFIKDRDWNFELTEELELRTTANILTFLMIPLGATFSDDISIIGCDGRPLEDNHYFWGHNSKTQFDDKMANIREIHPGFFAIDYNDYYREHCETLEQQLISGEARGKVFRSIGFSHIPALNSRYGRGARVTSSTRAPTPVRVVIIDPELGNSTAYSGDYNDNLVAALRFRGFDVTVLCNSAISQDTVKTRDYLQRLLPPNSWKVDLTDSKSYPRPADEEEILAALGDHMVGPGTVLLYMSTGSIEYAKALSIATQRFPNVFVNLNLFYLQKRHLEDIPWIEKWRSFFSWLDDAEPRFRVTIPTRELQKEVALVFGTILDVAPHPSTRTVPVHLPSESTGSKSDGGLQILILGDRISETGIDSAIACARLLGAEKRVHTVVQSTVATRGLYTEPPTANMPENLTIVDYTLSEFELAQVFRENDVLVIPDMREAIDKRTLDFLVDALYFELPVVVFEDTWMAGVLRQYGFGMVVETSGINEIKQGVLEVLADIESHRSRANAASKRYFEENSWNALVSQILNPMLAKRSYPKVAVVDLTSMDGISATGRVKEAFFRGWPESAFLLASLDSRSGKMMLTGLAGEERMSPAELDIILDAISTYSPDVIYYRAVENEVVSEFAEALIERERTPLVLHVMDDWPSRLKLTNAHRFEQSDAALRRIASSAVECLGISEAMNRAFEERYGQRFTTFANAIDPASFPPRSREYHEDGIFVIRYTGALAEDMTLESITEFAYAVEALGNEMNVQLQIYTRQPWLGIAQKYLYGWKNVAVFNQVPSEIYYDLLQNADALLIAYNFDAGSNAYIGLSMANKVPEYLASGPPIIAYGARGVATIDYLDKLGCAVVINDRNQEHLKEVVRDLIQAEDDRIRMEYLSRAVAFSSHNVWRISDQFRLMMNRVAGLARSSSEDTHANTAVVGPMSREEGAHWDETNCIAQLFDSTLSGSVMIDVGAHHGSALIPFLKKGWNVIAFEPDENNRAKLLGHLANRNDNHLVLIDPRCVSNKSKKGVPFYRSEQSTGISGLSAFHESHVEVQRADTTTLRDFFQDRPLSQIDFLKIDTEGYDLLVLQGFPWERTRPAVIECEFEDSKTEPLGYTFHDMADFLIDKGYTLYVSEWHPIIQYGNRHDWCRLVRYPCELEDPNGWGNLLAFRDPIGETELVDVVNKVLKFSAEEVPNSAHTCARNVVDPLTQKYHFGFRFEPSPHFSRVGPNQWRYTHSDAPQKLLIAAVEVGQTAARRFVGCLRLQADHTMTVKVTLGRHGETEWEGTAEETRLAPGVSQSITLSRTFSKDHAALKLQVEVLDLEDSSTAMLILDAFGVGESLDSLSSRINKDDLTLSKANKLFREGEMMTAMAMYLLLHHQRPLKIYPDNALLAARRLGMHWVESADELGRLFG